MNKEFVLLLRFKSPKFSTDPNDGIMSLKFDKY